jgi:hypothetical protein
MNWRRVLFLVLFSELIIIYLIAIGSLRTERATVVIVDPPATDQVLAPASPKPVETPLPYAS